MSSTNQNSMEIAKAACKYSRAFILKGDTQIINNSYDPSQRQALEKAVKDLREMCGDETDFYQKINKEYQEFCQKVELSKKFSLGNCHEMALLALDYVLRNTPSSVKAEVYYIQGGDHVFLVIGRDPLSNANKPETWGENAYICDPWSNKVYPASDYLNQTKNYCFYRMSNKDYYNYLEDFDSNKHQLQPLISATQLREYGLKPMISLFEKKMQAFLNSLDILEKKLTSIAKRLQEKYPNNPEKKIIIEKLLVQLKENIEKTKVQIKTNFTQPNGNKLYLPHEFHNFKNQLIEKQLSFLRSAILNKTEKDVLMTYHNEHSYLTKALKFFKIKPKTARDTTNALDETYKSIEKLSKK